MSSIVAFLADQGVHVAGCRGGWQPVKCPFHEDRHASASLNSSTERFHCFACDIHEDVIGLIRRVNNCGYMEAKREAEAKYGEAGDRVANASESGGTIFSGASDKYGNSRDDASWRSSFA